MFKFLLARILCVPLFLGAGGLVQISASPSWPPGQSSSAIAVNAEGSLLFAVNPDSNSVTIVDTTSRTALAEITVGVDPRTIAISRDGKYAYTANRGSDTVSVIDVANRRVIAQTKVGVRPYGVVTSPDGKWLYVSEQGSDQLRILDALSLESVSLLPVADRPAGLAINARGTTLYITHLLTNAITVMDLTPRQIFLPLVSAEGRSAAVKQSDTGVAELTPVDDAKPATVRDRPGITVPMPIISIPLWADSNLIQSITFAPDGRRAYVPHTRSNTGNRGLTFDTTLFPLVSTIDLEQRRHLIGQQFDLGTLDPPGVGLPFEAAVTPDGGELWIVNAASNDVSVLDLDERQLVAHIEVGDNPRAITLSPDGTLAYVNNTLAGTVSVIDTKSYSVTDLVTVTDIPLPPLLLQGKRLFYSSDDPRMGRAQWISCNSCHFDGDHDGRTWFFGFSGPRNTTALLGMVETYPLRWSGEWDESADSEFALRRENFGDGLLEGDMHCTLSPPDCVNQPLNQGRSADLDALAAFIDSLPIQKHPAYADSRPLDEQVKRGQLIFHNETLGCADCHPAPLYTDQRSHDVGTATQDEKIGPAFDTPSLRSLYDSAPYFHDGSAATLRETLTRPSPGQEHDLRDRLDENEIQDLLAFLMALPFQ